MIIDESQNLRNREGKRYHVIQDYIEKNESKVILLSATPYNKTYLDLSGQLRLFVPEDKDLGTRPERLLRELGETEFLRRHQCPIRSLSAFEKSEYADDWRELMRFYLVRRTRSFIMDNYAETDISNGRKYLTYEDGRRSYFPARKPTTVKFKSAKLRKRFKWLRPTLFIKALEKDLRDDVHALLRILKKCGEWNASKDAKLEALYKLLMKKHPSDKIIVFSQFADTVYYLESQLRLRGVPKLASVTGDSPDPTTFAWKFSPVSNEKRDIVKPEDELRILIATDVLSEGQNLQDCSIVVNYDLPWAIIRLIQRAGRVDRIGQQAENIICYSFLPAEGVERIIRLRARVRTRLKENAEVVGTDEAFFEDDRNDEVVLDLYNEKANILDGEVDTEVDLASYAYQIWKNAITQKPDLQKIIPELPPVVYSTRAHQAKEKDPEGVLVYLKTAESNDALARIDKNGDSVTESQFEILKSAECLPENACVTAP